MKRFASIAIQKLQGFKLTKYKELKESKLLLKYDKMLTIKSEPKSFMLR